MSQVRDDFPFLPAGCTVDLDRQSRELVLENLKAAVYRTRWATLVSDLRREGDGIELVEFLDRHTHRSRTSIAGAAAGQGFGAMLATRHRGRPTVDSKPAR